MADPSEAQVDTHQERAYRRGYVYGVATVISGLVHKLSEAERKEVDAWFESKLVAWSRENLETAIGPPNFPGLDDALHEENRPATA